MKDETKANWFHNIKDTAETLHAITFFLLWHLSAALQVTLETTTANDYNTGWQLHQD